MNTNNCRLTLNELVERLPSQQGKVISRLGSLWECCKSSCSDNADELYVTTLMTSKIQPVKWWDKSNSFLWESVSWYQLDQSELKVSIDRAKALAMRALRVCVLAALSPTHSVLLMLNEGCCYCFRCNCCFWCSWDALPALQLQPCVCACNTQLPSPWRYWSSCHARHRHQRLHRLAFRDSCKISGCCFQRQRCSVALNYHSQL